MRKVREVVVAEEVLRFESDWEESFNLKFTSHYGFVRSLCQKGLKEEIKEFADSIRDRFDNFVQVGIGGSALPLTASLKFLGIDGNEKRYFVLDNIDPERVRRIFNLNIDRTFFHFVSKSGSTTETVALLNLFFNRLKLDQMVFTTSQRGFLYEIGEKYGIKRFFIPQEVGGRYSVFTPVALLGLAFFGFDIERFIEGGKTAVRAYRNGFDLPNRIVDFVIGNYKKGKNILVFWVYKDALVSVGDWFRQLWAESLGKNGVGQTPVVALGVTDQHSQLQLYQDGPKDKAIMFVDSVCADDFEIENRLESALFEKKSLCSLMEIEKNSTKRALEENGVAVSELFLQKRDEFSLAILFMSLMLATAKAGEVLGVDPFSQPGVELGKKYTKEALRNG